MIQLIFYFFTREQIINKYSIKFANHNYNTEVIKIINQNKKITITIKDNNMAIIEGNFRGVEFSF